jgi:hypothetical protein
MTPSQEDHIAKERHNAEVEATLSANGNFSDWSATVLFYRALHLVDAYFAERASHPQNHHQRILLVNQLLPEVASDYADLYDVSIDARYEAIGLVDPTRYADAQFGFERIDQALRRLLPT